VKVVDQHGWLRPPIVANFSSEEQAIDAVKLMVGDSCRVEIKAQRDDVMKAAFGEIPQGSALFRADWTWRGDDENTPEPY
jgi:hypothetical protein